MSSREFTVDLCETLYASRKRVASTLEWRTNRANSFILQAKALTEEGAVLDVVGYWSLETLHPRRHWGFSLRYNGHIIRSFDMARSHKNPGESGRIKGPHKHKFKSSKIPRYAYKPSPAICDKDPNQSLIDFLAEANIDVPEGLYQNLIFP